MEKLIIKVDGMSCDHCIKAITKAVNTLSGISSVDVSLETGTVTVEYDPAQSSPDIIKYEIEDQGYDIIG